MEATKANGFDVEKIVARATDNKIVWDSANDCFAYIEKGKSEPTYIPDTKTNPNVADYQLWTIVDNTTLDANYSSYIAGTDITGPVVAAKGVDVGENTGITAVSYTNTGDKQDVVIRTNSASTDLTINAPLDTVTHYDEVGNVKIIAVAPASYHESGSVSGEVTLSEGHFVVETGASLAQPITIKDTTGDVKVTTNEAAAVIVDSAVTTNVSIDSVDSSKPVYVDDRTTGNIVIKPENAVIAIEISSEAGFENKETDFAFNNTMLDNAANVLNGYYKLTSNVSVNHVLFIPENATVVLDLNGYKITSNFDGLTILNLGNLTINDSSTGKTGIVHNICTTNTNGNWSHDAVRNYGMLIINGGTFGDDDLIRDNANTEHRGAAIRNAAGQCVINGGYFTCGDNYYTWGNKTSFSYAIRSSGNMIINNATVYGAMNGGVSADAGHIEINGGSFTVSKTNTYYVVVNGNGTTTINGGLFTRKDNDRLFGGFSGMPSWDATGNLASSGFVVNGGTFIVNGESITLN